MKKSLNYILVLSVFILLITLSSCDKKTDDKPNEAQKGTLQVEFDNVAGSQNLNFGVEYTNTNTPSQKIKFNMLKYFISNIKLKNSNGGMYVIPQDSSYFMIDEASLASQTISLKNVPEGDYVEMSFVIGVDSLRSTMPNERRTGVLDVTEAAQGMYWVWNSGYIFFKLEGTSTAAITATNAAGALRYHIGGFGGFSAPTTNNIRTKTIGFGNNKAMVRTAKRPKVHLMVDILKVLNGTTSINVATNFTIMGGPNSVNVANNLPDAFGFDHLHN